MVIYDIHGRKLMDAILTEGAVLERELGKTDVVKLSWNSDKKSTLPVGSYIVPFDDGLKYRLLDDYTPSEGSTSLKYEPAFNHPLAALSRIPFLYDTTDQDGNPIKQQEWPYDGLTTNALEYACKAINEALGITDESKKFTYTLCGTVDPTISFSVSSNDILSVLSSMAQACKDNSSEWHLSWEDHTLYFGQIFINLGEKVPLLKVHDNINPATVNSSNEPYYNCFYPQGSSRNMSRKAQVGLGNVATLVRLGLNKNKFPDGCIYVDKDSNVITKEEFVQSGAVKQMVALSFDDVYPHIDLYAYNVRPRYRYLKNKQTNEIEKDANGKNKVYTTWYMRLAYPTTVKDDTKTLVNTTNDIDEQGKQVTHYWYDYELNVKEQVLQGHTLKAMFKVNTHATDGKYDALTQSLVGQPNGQDGFELAYFDKNDAKEIPSNQNDGDSGINIKAGDYQIMFYQNGDIIIPTNVEEGLYPRGNNLPDFTCNIVVLFNIKQGQQEIASAQEELAKRTVKEIERRFKDNNNYSFSSNPVVFEEKNPKLHIGQKVIFNDGQGYELSTRVIKIESKIDFPFIQNITVGNQAVKGAITQLKEDVKSILSGNFSGGGGLNASQIENVIKNFTLPRFLRKDVADEAKGHITFWQGLTALVKSFFNGIENNGDIRNKGDITNAGNIMTKNLTVTDKATFFELEIQKAKAAGGIIIQSAATFKVDDCEDTAAGYVCYQLAEKDGKVLRQMCRKGDQMLCHGGLNVGVGASHNASNHYYWRLVTDVSSAPVERGGKKYLKIVLSKTEFADGSDKPQVGDELAQVGNRVDTDRQCVIINSAYHSLDKGLVAPYWAKYVGVNDYILETHRETYFARNDNQIVGNLRARSSSGEIRPVPALLGEWKSGKEYGYYDSVTHDGRQWLCVAVRGTKTTEEPGKGDAWMLLVDKGEKGRDGHSLVAKAFMEGSYRNGFTKDVKSYVKVYYDGQEVTDFKVSYRYKGDWQKDWSEPLVTNSGVWGDVQRDGSTLFVEYAVEYKGLKAVATGRLDNIQDGKDGIAGKDGKDGRTTYFHVKYANVASPTSSSQMNETGGDYMGTYVDFTQADSDDPKRYTWIKTKGAQGADGTQGIAGKNGADGRTSYLHIKYSNDGGNTFTSNSGEDTGDYIGQYVDFTQADSNNPRDYKWGLVKGKDGKDAVVWQVAFSIRHITDKQGETFRLKVVRIVGDKAEEVDHAAIIAAGADLLVFGDDMGAELRVNPGEDYLTTEYPHSRYLMARVVMYGTDITLAQDTIYPEAKSGKDAVTYKLIPLSENVVAYISEDKVKKIKTNKVDIRLKYKIMKSAGEQVNFTTLEAEGMTLTIQPSVGDGVAFTYKSGMYRLELSGMKYKEIPDNSYTVTLKKGNDIVDQRIVPITFKPNVVFDIDTVNGTITSQIEAVDGRINSVERNIEKTSSTVGKLDEKYTLIEQTSKEIKLTVNNGTRPNLLWGSDLNLDGVDTTNKAAIQKHLGVGLNATRVDSTEWFEYLKGEGVAGADAIRFKNAYKREDWAKLTNISWRDVPLKPNTKYTISVWVKFKSYGKKGRMYVDCYSDDGRWNFGGYLLSEHHYSREDIDEWQRVRYVFNSGASKKMSSLLFACIADEEEGAQCEMWLCHPKLEEGDTATPWCAYDGMVEELLDSGLDIKNRKMIATTDNFKVQNNKGEQTFLVDKNGRINAKLIDATEIYGLKIAQPFETYASKEELKNGKSLSWVMETWEKDYGFILGQKGMNGVTLNIFNCTGSSISFTIPLITPSKICQVEVPNNVMLRAVAIYRKVWNGCQWYLICPWEDIGNNRIRIKAFG